MQPGKCRQVRGAQLFVAIIDEVQIFDQQVMAQRLVTDQRLHLGQRRRADDSASRRLALALLGGSDRGHGYQGLIHRSHSIKVVAYPVTMKIYNTSSLSHPRCGQPI